MTFALPGAIALGKIFKGPYPVIASKLSWEIAAW